MGLAGEEAFEFEDGLLEELEAQYGDDERDRELGDGKEEMSECAAGDVGVGEVNQAVHVEHRQERVVDVDAVAVLAEEAHAGIAEDAGGARARLEAHCDEGGGGERQKREAEGEEKVDAAFGGVIEEEDGYEEQGCGDEDGSCDLECGRVQARAQGEREGSADEETVESGDEGGVEELPRIAVKQEPDADEERGEGDSYGKEEEAFWSADEEDAEWPDEIELLFDVKRPEVDEADVAAEVEVPIGTGAGFEEAVGIGEEAPLLASPVDVIEGSYREEKKKDCVVERKDAESAAGVEAAEVVRVGDGLDEDAGDEEAGKSEEDVDTSEEGALNPAGQDIDGSEISVVDVDEVMTEDHEDGEAANAVECGVVAQLGFGGGSAGRGRLLHMAMIMDGAGDGGGCDTRGRGHGLECSGWGGAAAGPQADRGAAGGECDFLCAGVRASARRFSEWVAVDGLVEDDR